MKRCGLLQQINDFTPITLQFCLLVFEENNFKMTLNHSVAYVQRNFNLLASFNFSIPTNSNLKKIVFYHNHINGYRSKTKPFVKRAKILSQDKYLKKEILV